MATTSLANRSASVSSEPDATSDGHVGASLCWRYARISLVLRYFAHTLKEIKSSIKVCVLVIGLEIRVYFSSAVLY